MNVEKLKNLYSACRDKYAAAKEMGTTYQTLYNIIYKGSVCKVDLLQQIAKYFNVPVSYFFDEEEEIKMENETVQDGKQVPYYIYKDIMSERDKYRDRCIELEKEIENLETKLIKYEPKERKNVG